MIQSRSPEQVKAWLERHGVTATEWARQHGFPPTVVFALLSGRTRGRRGAAHRAAIALGLKSAPPEDEEFPIEDERPESHGRDYDKRRNH